MNYKKLQEIAESKGKQLLIEKTLIPVSKENIEVFNKPELVESIEGENKSCIGVLRKIPISTYIENDNGRIYSRPLWENVYQAKVAENTLSLDGHPEDEGKYKDVCGIWKNFQITETCPIADLYLIGDTGKKILEIIDLGGKVGVSSVGYGEFLEDNKTVNPKTFELARLGDLVLDPSQRTYITKENMIESKDKNEENKVFLEDKNTNNILEEKNAIINNEVKNMDKLQEANFRNQIYTVIREAKKSSNFIEGIDMLEKTDTGGFDDLEAKVSSAIDELKNKLEEKNQNAENKISSISEELNELQSKYDVACQSLEEMKNNYNKAKAIIEKVGLKEDDEEIDNLVEKTETYSSDIKKLTEDKEKIEKRMTKLKEERDIMFSDIKQLITDRKNMLSDIKQFIKERKIMISDIKTLIEKYKAIKEKNIELDKQLKEHEMVEEEEPYTFSNEEIEEPVEEMPTEEPTPVEEEDEEPTDLEYSDIDETMIEADEIEMPEEPMNDMEVEEDEEIVEPDMAPEETIEEPVEEAIEDGIESEEVIDTEGDILPEEDEEPMDDMMDYTDEEDEVVESIQESYKSPLKVKKDNKGSKPKYKNKVIQEEIQKVFNNEVKVYPAVKNIKKLIFESKSVVEALNKISKFKEARKPKQEVPTRKVESILDNRPEYLRGRR